MKPIRLAALSAAASAALLLSAGCTTPPLPEPSTAADPVPALTAQVAPAVTVHYDNELVARALQVVNASMTKSGQLPKLAFSIRNKISERYPIEYQIEWRDADGAPLLVSSAWQQVTLTGNADKAVQSIGKSVNARSAAITIRIPQQVEIYVPEPDPVEQMKMQQQYNQQLLQQNAR